MPNKETDILTGTITDWERNDAPRPSKLRLEVGEEEVELTVWAADKGQESMRSYLASINPADLIGTQVSVSVEVPCSEYQGTKQYKVKQLKALSGEPPKRSTPQPQAQPKAQQVHTPTSPPSRSLDPSNRDTLIVDQVIFKGAVALRAGGAEVEKAVADAIAVWQGVRARHQPEPVPVEPAFDDDIGIIDLSEDN